MRECQMQLSGPWPPYHFVHRLTRGAHVPAQAPAHSPAAVPQPAVQQMEPVLAAV
jgi:hypothetical protein